MRSFFRIVCLIIGVLAFVYALNELAELVFDTGEGRLGRFILLAAISGVAFVVILLQHNWETYPSRMAEERLEEELEREAERQLRTR